MSQGKRNKPVARACFKDDGIVIEFPRKQIKGDEKKITFLRQDFSTEALEEATSAPEARLTVEAVLSRPSCVQRTDVESFGVHMLLPRSGKTREKEKIWRGLLGLLESLGYEVQTRDLRAQKLRRAS